jgi:hypothetical protein
MERPLVTAMEKYRGLLGNDNTKMAPDKGIGNASLYTVHALLIGDACEESEDLTSEMKI